MATENATQIISGASAGRALRGFWPARVDTHDRGPWRFGKKTLLTLSPENVEDVRLMNSNKAVFSAAYSFPTSEESSSFSKCVEEKGWSVATRLHASSSKWGVSADDSFDTSKSSKTVSERDLNTKVTRLCITQCVYMPVSCFQIPRSKMVLGQDALQQALAIGDSADAIDFLCSFGPFVSESLYHLGGIFFSENTVKCSEETTLLALMNQTQQELKGSFSGNADAKILSVKAEFSGEQRERTENERKTSSTVKLENKVEKITVLGPVDAVNVDEFRQKVREDPGCMAIIDKDIDSKDSLVGVWELLLQHADLLVQEHHGELNSSARVLPEWRNVAQISLKFKCAAKFLCERWMEEATAELGRASSSAVSTEYSALIHQGRLFLATLSSSEPTLSSVPPAARQTLPWLPESPDPEHEENLAQALENLVAIAEADLHHVSVQSNPNNLSQNVADLLRRIFSRPSANDSASTSDQEGQIRVLHSYGFNPDRDEWVSQLDLMQLKCMIQELKEISGAKSAHRPRIPSSLWDDRIRPGPLITDPQYEFRYVGDVLLDRNVYQAPSSFSMSQSGTTAVHAEQVHMFRHAAACRLLDCLRHRLDLLSHVLQPVDPSNPSFGSSQDPLDDVSWGSEEGAGEGQLQPDAEDGQAECHDSMGVSPFELLIQIMQGADFSTQIAVCDLLLTRRAAIPLVFPSNVPQRAVANLAVSQVRLVHYVQALSFVEVSLENEGTLCIASDTSLPRVVFISSRRVEDSHSAIVASRVLSCEFTSQHLREQMNRATEEMTIMEMGVGFVPSCGLHHTSNAAAGRSEKSDYMPCVCILISGDYKKVLSFVGDFADVVIHELDEREPEALQQWQGLPVQHSPRVLGWRETGTKARFDARKKVLWGQETYLVQSIQKILQRHMSNASTLQIRSSSVIDVCSKHFAPGTDQQLQHLDQQALESMLDLCDFRDIRKKLSLQRSLVREAEAYFEGLLLLHDPAKKHEKDRACDQERDRRLGLAKGVLSLTVMKLFYHVLTQGTVSQRRFGIVWLERALSKNMSAILEDASLEVDRLFVDYNRDRENKRAKTAYRQAKEDYVDKSLGVENLWREMCHIYEADPDSQRPLARLAAQHLVDGFALEILDGDAGMYCKLWIDSVLVELESMTKVKPSGRSARIFVLSVMGLQSSGKTTMLNLMFGCQLRTSAGRCTRGVYIQLVPSEREEYDYVLLLDTEGLRSPEFAGLPASLVRDNRLATLGLLPADASMFMVCNEDDGGLKEVLPMVLLAFKGSAIAEECGQRIKAKVVFIYRSVNINDKKKLRGSTQKLHEHLMEAAEEVRRMGGVLTTTGGKSTDDANQQQLSAALLSDFRVQDSEMESDVKFFGNLKKGSKPPADTPEWEYGKSVVALREYLHSRVVNDSATRVWKGSSLSEFSERLKMVWDCVCSANFELSFATRVQYAAYLELQAALQPPRVVVCSKYLKAFRDLEEKLFREDNAGLGDGTSSSRSSATDLESSALAGVQVVVQIQTDEVEKILDKQTSYAQWKPQELDNWKRFCESTHDWYKKRVRDLISGVLGFDKVVARYQQQCKSILVDEIERGQWGAPGQSDEAQRKSKFEEVFKRIVDDAERKHPPVAKDVGRKIHDRYVQSGVAKVINTQADAVDGAGKPTGSKGALWDWLPSWGKGSSNTQAGNGYPDLGLMIDRHLRDANQYSDVIVDNVIIATKETLQARAPNLSRDKQSNAHVWVKKTLTERLKDIQTKWDKSHNVAEKLKSDAIRGELENFFADLCQGLEVTLLVVNQLQRSLEKELEEAHRVAVVRYVVDSVGSQSWIRSWRLMRSFLDYHLLTLMQRPGDTETLLRYVTDGPQHFTEMMNALVGQAITEELVQREWSALVQKVQNCLKEEGGVKNPSLHLFLGALRRRLDATVDGKLANALLNIHVKGEDKRRELDGELYEKRLPEMCERLQKIPMPAFTQLLPQVRREVMQELSNIPDENCRPRCGASCPVCGSTCYHAKGHSAARHDTIHQPAGLAGTRWHKETALVERSCQQCLETGCGIVVGDDDRSVPFSDFDKLYPDWAAPTNLDATAIQVRECVFYHYHQQLAGFFNRTSTPDGSRRFGPPRHVPAAYNHNPAHLRGHLDNSIRATFPNEAAWMRFKQLLTTGL